MVLVQSRESLLRFESAEDVVQDAFAAVARQELGDVDLVRYLRAAVVNRSRSILRFRRLRRGRTAYREQTVAAADVGVLKHGERTRILNIVDRLPRRQREVVVLRFYLDLTTAETA